MHFHFRWGLIWYIVCLIHSAVHIWYLKSKMADQYGRQTAKIEEINNNHSISHLLVTTWDILLLYSILMIDSSAMVFALSFRLNDIPKTGFPAMFSMILLAKVSNSFTFTTSLETTPYTMFLKDGSGENGVQVKSFSFILSRTARSRFNLASVDSRCCSLVV